MGIILAITAAHLGCVSKPHRLIQNVNPGMEKDQVLDIMGSPQRTFRNDGRDIWIYIYYVQQQRSGAEVTFADGKVVSVRRAELDKTLTDELLQTTDMATYQKLILDQRKGEGASRSFKDLE